MSNAQMVNVEAPSGPEQSGFSYTDVASIPYPSRTKRIRMISWPSLLTAVISILLFAVFGPTTLICWAQSTTNQASKVSENVPPPLLVHGFVKANGVRLHYVVVGSGEPVLLLPGWPESWYAWHQMMGELAMAGRQVYALDPRGYGDSEKPASGYDLSTAADDIHAFIVATGLERPGGIDIIAHDLGTWIAYAHASTYPGDVRRLVVSEAAIPGLESVSNIPDDATNIKTWHFAFNRLDDLPEILVQGHERAYLTWLFTNKSWRTWQITPDSLNEYLRVFLIPGTARADFSYYREAYSPANLERMRQRAQHKLSMPILAVGAEGGVGLSMFHTMQALGQKVQGVELRGCGHYLPDECPDEFTNSIVAFWKD